MRLALVLALLAPLAAAAQTRAGMDCKPTGKDLVYDCVIRLARADKPVSDAQFTVTADMPSMPMAHNLEPVKARPGKGPGEYHVRLDLDMPGEWSLKLRFTAPARDLVVLHYEFDERGSHRVRGSGTAPRR